MKLLLALGNPESKYNGTRHNVGFFVADTYAAEQGLTWQAKPKFKSVVAESNGYLIAKPTTYYNLVGESARAIADFYKISPHDILVMYDDLALPLGTVRTRMGGSPAGNNGIKSLNQHLGEGTARLRIGTYTDSPMDQTDFVLGRFTAAERQIINNVLPKITGLIDAFLSNSFEVTTHK